LPTLDLLKEPKNNLMTEKSEHRYACRQKDFWKIFMDVKLMCGHLVSYCINFHMGDYLWNIAQLKRCSGKAYKFN